MSAYQATYTGRLVYPYEPERSEFAIDDIAHHLALVNRYCGASPQPYSVAQHSVLVAKYSGKWALEGLLHDAAEAYLQDLPQPVKQGQWQYMQAEDAMFAEIARQYELSDEDECWETVRNADHRVFSAEVTSMMRNPSVYALHPNPIPEHVVPMHWELAENEFLETFHRLWRARHDAMYVGSRSQRAA